LLFVIFVFALVPAGFSQARVLGSAFDPSTSVVSLKESSRQPEERKLAARSDGEPDSAAAAAGAKVLPVSIASVDGRKDQRPRWSLPPLEADAAVRSPSSSFQARAPPIA
jgi:hypothetical protein